VATADLAETAAIGIVAAATTVADAAETVADAAEIVPAVTVARVANASPARAAAMKAPSRRLLQRSLLETMKIKRHPGLRAGTHLT
jgi:hypothetical protein